MAHPLSQGESQSLCKAPYKATSLISSLSIPPLAFYTLALFLEHSQHNSASGPLHLLSPLSGRLFPPVSASFPSDDQLSIQNKPSLNTLYKTALPPHTLTQTAISTILLLYLISSIVPITS